MSETAGQSLSDTGPPERRRELEDVFLSCLREPDLAISTGPLRTIDSAEERSYLGGLAQRHRLFGVLYAQSRFLGWDPSAIAPEGHHLRYVAQQMRLHVELMQLGGTLDALGVPWLTFKGVVLAETAYPRPDLRAFGDIDVLVSPSDLRRVLDVLSDQGVTLYSEAWSELERTERSQLSLLTERFLPVDLHWHLFNNPGVRRAFPVDTDELLGRRVMRETSRGTVWSLDDADTVLHLAAHGAQSGGELLIWVLDLSQAFKALSDYESLVQRARSSRLGLTTAIMLARCQHLLGTPVSGDLLDALAPQSLWRRGLTLLDERRPPHHSVLGTGQVLFTSTRETTASSLTRLARASLQQAVLPFFQEADHPWRVALRRGRPAREVRRPAVQTANIGPDSHGRDAFLRYVDRDQRVTRATAARSR